MRGKKTVLYTYAPRGARSPEALNWDRRVRSEAAKARRQKLTKILNIRGSKTVNKIRTYFPDNVSD